MGIRPFAFGVQRFDPAEDDAPADQTYTLDVPEGMTVLEALVRIQAEQDGTLAFRYACRGAVCGLFAMATNGREGLACRTQIHGLLEEEHIAYLGPTRMEIGERAEDRHTITVEPLRDLRMIKDLAVDMEPLFGKLDAVEPWLGAHEPAPEREHLVGPDQSAEAAPDTNCVLCGCCYSACPVADEAPPVAGSGRPRTTLPPPGRRMRRRRREAAGVGGGRARGSGLRFRIVDAGLTLFPDFRTV